MFKILQAVRMLGKTPALIFEVCRIHFIVIACDGFDGVMVY